jgi:hypothetical protein
MEDRIQINGEWYVKESTTESQPVELDLSYFLSCIHETKNYVFEAIRTYDDYEKGKFFSNFLDIEFTDKRTEPWKTDTWDNSTWLLGVHHNDKSALADAFELMDGEGVRELKNFIRELINKGWLIYE